MSWTTTGRILAKLKKRRGYIMQEMRGKPAADQAYYYGRLAENKHVAEVIENLSKHSREGVNLNLLMPPDAPDDEIAMELGKLVLGNAVTEIVETALADGEPMKHIRVTVLCPVREGNDDT